MIGSFYRLIYFLDELGTGVVIYTLSLWNVRPPTVSRSAMYSYDKRLVTFSMCFLFFWPIIHLTSAQEQLKFLSCIYWLLYYCVVDCFAGMGDGDRSVCVSGDRRPWSVYWDNSHDSWQLRLQTSNGGLQWLGSIIIWWRYMLSYICGCDCRSYTINLRGWAVVQLWK